MRIIRISQNRNKDTNGTFLEKHNYNELILSGGTI